MQGDTVRNYGLETLLYQLNQKKEEETQRYFDQLAGNAIKEEANKMDEEMKQDNKQGQKLMIETIFTNNLKESLLKFQNYQKDVLFERDTTLDKIRKKYAMMENAANFIA